MGKLLRAIFALAVILFGGALAAGEWCYDDSDCGYNEYCNGNECVSSSGSRSNSCCGTYAILLGVVGLGAFAKYKHIF
ncbi:MAG: hypothetical protein N3G76_00830 [Candidatus Micrarchaeota archaeon]|nr:hypothetical protein [Candidatus Micrarchaeota archaeon]